MMKRLCSLVALAFAFTSISCAKGTEVETKENTATESVQMKSLGFLGPSFYWVALETNDGEPKTKQVLDVKGNLLVTVSQKFYKGLHMEGTGRLLDGRLLNFASRIHHPDGSQEYRYRWVGPEAPYGYGYDLRPLVPFRTLAVDPNVVPLDSTLYIPAAKGAVLPDGTIHDGYFKALDIGSAIVNRRIDIFTSFGDQSSVFKKNGLQHGVPVEVFLVD